LKSPDGLIGRTLINGRACFAPSTEEVYDQLLHAVMDSKNFKVRIHAAAALGAPTVKERYEAESGSTLSKIHDRLSACLDRLQSQLGKTSVRSSTSVDDAASEYGPLLLDQVSSFVHRYILDI
jgi:hypothetical protein